MGSSPWFATSPFLGCAGGEPSDAADNSLTFALLWLRHVRDQMAWSDTGVRIILPRKLAALSPTSHCSHPQIAGLYEHDPALNIFEKIDQGA